MRKTKPTVTTFIGVDGRELSVREAMVKANQTIVRLTKEVARLRGWRACWVWRSRTIWQIAMTKAEANELRADLVKAWRSRDEARGVADCTRDRQLKQSATTLAVIWDERAEELERRLGMVA